MARAAEACFLLRVLCEHNVGRLAARMEEGTRAQLRGLRFRCAKRQLLLFCIAANVGSIKSSCLARTDSRSRCCLPLPPPLCRYAALHCTAAGEQRGLQKCAATQPSLSIACSHRCHVASAVRRTAAGSG